jgi:hypothetical protein
MCLSQEEGLAVRAGAERESACINVAMHCAIRNCVSSRATLGAGRSQSTLLPAIRLDDVWAVGRVGVAKPQYVA